MLDNQNLSTKSQLDKLERISNQISLLISQNDYEKISHLDKMRKKIIIGSRGSLLALLYAEKVKESIIQNSDLNNENITVEGIANICKKYDVPVPAAAIQFCYTNKLVTSMILGMDRLDQVEQNLDFLNFPIPEDLWKDLLNEKLIDERCPI